MVENIKLGKRAVRRDHRTLKLAKYFDPKAIDAPASCSYTERIPSWPMMLNDRLGCCVIAGAGHDIMQWTAYGSTEQIPTDQDILAGYEAIGGYKPGDESTDNGCVMLDALNYWRQAGIGGHKIDAFVQVNHSNDAEVDAAIYSFGNLYIGLALPASAQGKQMWTVTDPSLQGDAEPGSWGGHCVTIVRYAPDGFMVVTWGELLYMSRDFFKAYCDEAYAVLSQEWINKTMSAAVNGIDLDSLRNDLQVVSA